MSKTYFWKPLVLVTCMASCHGNSKTNLKSDQKTKEAYTFAIPKGWTKEHIPFPIEFAPQIPYQGSEELRFAPGWENVSSEEHWTYAFLWWLSGKPVIDAATLQEYMSQYYTGLLSRNIQKRSIPAADVITPKATITKTTTVPGDVATYTGTIIMLDYLNLIHPVITLNCQIHQKDCNGHPALVFQISPQPLNHSIWQQLNNLNNTFSCK